MNATGTIAGASANLQGIVQKRFSSQDLSTCEVVHKEASAIKKVQVVECDSIKTNERLLRHDEEIATLKELVCKK